MRHAGTRGRGELNSGVEPSIEPLATNPALPPIYSMPIRVPGRLKRAFVTP